MNNRIVLWGKGFAAFTAAFALSCAPQRLSGGSEIGNPTQTTLVGSVVYSGTSTAAAGAYVRLRPKMFTRDTALAGVHRVSPLVKNTVTDSVGRFSVGSVDTGDYCMEIADGNSSGALIYCEVAPGSGPVTTLPVVLLKPVAEIRGAIPAAVLPLCGSVYVQVYGLDRVARAEGATGLFVIKNVPEGSYSLRLLCSSPDVPVKNVESVAVEAGGVADIGAVRLFAYQGWAYSRKIVLNTAQSGAGITGSVTRFPVLIRLTDSIVDFSAFAPGGADIRFTGPDSAPLPFEISRWDDASKRAEIWVSVDTVRGGDSTQYIVMYYGNASAPSASRGSAVFDIAAGFIAAWHLDGNCADATGGHDGTNFGAIDTMGIIGSAKKFNGGDSIRIAGLLGTPANVTLSAWVTTDTTAASGQDIISLGDAALIREDETVNAYGTGGYAHRYTKNGDTAFTKVTSGLNIAKTGWRYIAFTFDNETQTHSLYIDGNVVRVDSSAYPIDYTGVGVNTFIGAHGNRKTLYNNRGAIDEVRVCGVARSADWVKLCYMNQRPDGKLVFFK